MVAPVVPGKSLTFTSKVLNLSGIPIQVREYSAHGQRQKRPYNLPLTADLLTFGVVRSARTGYLPASPSRDSGQANSVRQDWVTNPREYADAYNKAYSKFKEGVGTSASWGVNLAEMHQSVSMIKARAEQLLAFGNSLRRLNVVGAARALGMAALPETFRKASPRKRRTLAKDFGNAWLEFHFGWEPLIKDIGDSVEVLQRDLGHSRVTGRGSSTFKSLVRSFPANTVMVTGRYCRIQAKISADVIVSNPNLYLANHMGFTNPAVIAWELVPFSFVVDWFVNVGDFLSSFSDMFGVTISNANNTMFSRSTYEETSIVTYASRPDLNYRDYALMDAVRFQRVLGIGSGPVLKARPPKQVSVIRGATAISLLIQQLRSKSS